METPLFLTIAMTSIPSCLLNKEIVLIATALELRDAAKRKRQRPLQFKCIECHELVDPHHEGERSPTRFEHRVKNPSCSLSFRGRSSSQRSRNFDSDWITTAELARRTAGGIDYIRTKNGIVKGLALTHALNSRAPEIIVVGKGRQIEARAMLFLSSGSSVPAYIKRQTNQWELIGQYRAIAYRTDQATIKRDGDNRNAAGIAGILYTERTDEAAISIRGGGFADPETRRATELAAVAHVTAKFEALGYVVFDRQRDNLGYDLLATKLDSSVKLEVKGTGGPVSRFYLTRNEHRCASRDPDWRIAVVTNARTAPEMELLTFKDVESSYYLDPLAWECTRKAI